MFTWRSARGRTVLTGVVFMLLLAGVASVAVWRGRDDRQRHHSLERASVVALSLEHARARFSEGLGVLAAQVWAQEPMFGDIFRRAAAEVEEELAVAHREALAEGGTDRALALSDLIERMGRFNEAVDPIIPALLGPSVEGAAQVATARLPELMPEAYVIYGELDRLVQEEEAAFAAQREAADRASQSTLVLLLALSVAALVTGLTALVGLVLSVLRPLTSLEASVKAIASGDMEARSAVSGPEEVASLARAFNEMVDKRRRAEEALREQARRDPLTGVLNHGAIVQELRRVMPDVREGSSHAVAMVDVDGLKATNDTYGHQVGDTMLVEVARALVRDGAIVGRYGGDEFVALLAGAGRGAAERYRDAVLDDLAAVGATDPETGSRVPIAVSVGLAVCPAEAGTIEELIKRADSEMYAARRQRPVGPPGGGSRRRLTTERASRTARDIVPLLTSPGDLDEKLRLVAHRLSVGAGYDAVSFFFFFEPGPRRSALRTTYADAPDELVEAWDRDEQRHAPHPLASVLVRTRRPVILGDMQGDERVTDTQRKLLRAAGLRSGVVAPMIWQNWVIGALAVGSKQKEAFTSRDAEFLMAVANQVTAIVRMATFIEELESASGRLAEARNETVMMLAAAAEAHDHTTGLHLQNVRALVEALARQLGYGEEDASELGLAAVLHDIGKVRVPDFVLASTGRLADEEWELMKHHTTWGAEFLAGRPGFELAAAIARSHHERWDGSGYPDGLSGDAIPKAATIVAVADAFDAMTSHRPYRATRPVAAAVREIEACSGRQFSPRVVEALLRLHKRRLLSRLRCAALQEQAAA